MISANAALAGSYDYGEVARSVFIAIFASYAALDLLGRVNAARGRVRLAWLSGGAIAMGIGIWTMHFKGMLAFHLPVHVKYHWPTVLTSLLVAVLASAVALYVSSRHKMGSVEALTGSIFMGAGIAGMHYIGMAAMRLPAVTLYSPLLVTCSILLAILFSLLALFLAFDLREESRWSVPRRLGSATMMGVAVSAMHYTGMAAATFIPASPPDLSHVISISPVGNSGVAFVALIVLVAAATTSSVDRRRSDDQLRLVLDALPALVWSKSPDGSADFLNQRFSEYTGLSVEEGLGWGWMKEFRPEERAEDEWRAAFAAGEPFEKQAQLRRADGAYRWFLLRAVPVRDELGNVVKWYGTSTDIENQKRAEDELRKQKEIFQKIFENIPVLIAFRGRSGNRLELVNPEWERTTGWRLEEIRQQNVDALAEFFPDPHYRQAIRDLIAASTGQWTDIKVRVRDGHVIDVIAAFVRLSDGSTLFIARDITEGKRVDAELRESEARFRLVADSAPVMIWMSGVDKLCTYFNKPWLDFTGRTLADELGNGWAEGVDPEDLERCMNTYIQAFDQREAFRMEYRLRRHDGEFRWVSDTGVPRFNPDGSFAGYIGSCIDMTEQRRAEEQLHHAQDDLTRVTRVVAMGELAAAIAHEVNQPLTAIVTNANFCLRRLDGATLKTDELRGAIAAIANDGTRASGVISRIRGLLMKGAADRIELDINRIVQDVTSLMRNEFTRNRVSLRVDLASDLPQVRGDPVLLQQVLINLIMNAIEATISSTDVRREILIRSAKNQEGVLVQVQDSGPGIAPELADRIFEPFFTTKAKGIGMGLSISHSIIESHGGRLGIGPSSHGALFEFTLPTDDAGVS